MQRSGVWTGLWMGLAIAGPWGCGATPSATPHVPAPPPSDQIGMPATLAAVPDEQAIGLTFQMAEAVRALHAARYHATTFCRGKVGKRPGGLSPLPDGTWQATSHATEVYAAPTGYTVDVADEPGVPFAGEELRIAGEAVTIVGTGLRATFWGHAKLGDAKLLDFRGQRRDAFDLGGLARRLGGAASARYLGPTVRDGETIECVEVPRAPAGDPEVVREVVGIDVTSHLPVLVQRYTRTGLVYERVLSGIASN